MDIDGNTLTLKTDYLSETYTVQTVEETGSYRGSGDGNPESMP